MRHRPTLNPVATEVAEELRQRLAKNFGVTVVGPHLTLRWGGNRQASFIMTEMDDGQGGECLTCSCPCAPGEDECSDCRCPK